MLSAGAYQFVVVKQLCTQFGISRRIADGCIARARELIHEQGRLSQQELLDGAIALYRSVLADSDASTRDKIAAMRELTTLCIGPAVHRVALTDTAGNDLDLSTADLNETQLRAFAALLKTE
jgi:hypothetical protein